MRSSNLREIADSIKEIIMGLSNVVQVITEEEREACKKEGGLDDPFKINRKVIQEIKKHTAGYSYDLDDIDLKKPIFPIGRNDICAVSYTVYRFGKYDSGIYLVWATPSGIKCQKLPQSKDYRAIRVLLDKYEKQIEIDVMSNNELYIPIPKEVKNIK